MRAALFVIAAAGLVACTPDDGAQAAAPPLPTTPVELARGEAAFVASCAECHGIGAAGTEKGPPLAHIVYEPNHHGDMSFRLAVRSGVRAHHWRFGDMPPQPQVAPADVEEIIRYVRWVQRQRGIE